MTKEEQKAFFIARATAYLGTSEIREEAERMFEQQYKENEDEPS